MKLISQIVCNNFVANGYIPLKSKIIFMCGIAGFLNLPGHYHETLKSMVNAILHRGPDAQGYWISEDCQIALGHARLSINDLSDAGAQPMVSPSSRFMVSFNGEIYNHNDIRDELNSKENAPAWRGTSDTETLLTAIDYWGLDNALKKSIGMFAFALWDKKDKKLTLVRDRFGEKPLYYQPSEQGVIFASEISSIKQHPACSKKISQAAVQKLTEFRCIPSPLSIYDGVFKLMPGTLITFNLNGFIETRQWWSPLDATSRANNDKYTSETDAIAALEDRLDECIKRQMLADVPLGAFLSGGIDSSLIVALMAKNSSRSVKTYTIGFEDPQYDEAPYAEKIANFIGTEHTQHYVSSQDIVDLIPQIASIYSEPFADSSQLPTYLVSKLARKDVTVVLSGDAGDELFGGYNRHIFAAKHWRKMQLMPRVLRSAVAQTVNRVGESHLDRIFGLLPMTSNWTRIGEKLKRNTHAFSAESLDEFYLSLTRVQGSEKLVNNPRPSDSVSVYGPQYNLLLDTNDALDKVENSFSPMRCVMLRDQLGFLPNDILEKVDRAAMACSLETRVPFLDHSVAEFSQSLPTSMMLNGNSGKHILRRILNKYIAPELFDRPKMGFSLPINEMIKGPLRDWAETHLSQTALKNDEVFDAQAVRALWQNHTSGKRDNILQLWPVLMYQSWLDNC